MDLSALIFVALAVAWAVYLIPRALRQHEEATSRRPVDSFSHRMRVLARREPVDRKNARLVVTPGKPAPVIEADPLPVSLTPAQRRARRAHAQRAARRRRRVLLVLLFLVADAVGLALAGITPWWAVGAAGVVVVAWLVLCRVMVRREIAESPGRRLPVHVEPAPQPAEVDDDTDEISAVVVEDDVVAEAEAPEPEQPSDPPAAEGWDPVPHTLPTYTQKAAAPRRTVRTIDLDSTGVWTSGRTAADAALAREAEAADKAVKSATDEDGRRASGT